MGRLEQVIQSATQNDPSTDANKIIAKYTYQGNGVVSKVSLDAGPTSAGRTCVAPTSRATGSAR
jgi:hypothetical protein